MKISELNLAGAIVGTEVFPIVQGGETKKVSIADALAGAAPTLQSVLDTGNSATGANAHIELEKYLKILGTDYTIQLSNQFNQSVIQVQNGLAFNSSSYFSAYCQGVSNQLNGINPLQSYFSSTNSLGQQSLITLFTVGDNNKPTIEIRTTIPSLQEGSSTLRLTNNEIYFNGATIGTYLDNKTDGVFQTAFINLSNQKIYTGFELDFGGERYSFGDIGNSNASVLVCTPFNAKFNRGLNMQLDDINIKLGDYNTSGNQTVLEVDDFNRIIKTTSRGNEIGFRFDFANEGYFFGDYGVTSHGINLDNANANLNLFCSLVTILTGNASGFGASGNQSSIGDIDGNGNSTILGVDDNINSITVSGDVIGNNGLGTSDRLKVRINGSDYLIVLETP